MEQFSMQRYYLIFPMELYKGLSLYIYFCQIMYFRICLLIILIKAALKLADTTVVLDFYGGCSICPKSIHVLMTLQK